MGERLDEPGESDDSGEPDGGAGRSRRRFIVGAVKAGSAAGAAIWVAPKLSSVALAQETAGSPAPTTSTTEAPEVEPEVDEVPEVKSARAGEPSAGAGFTAEPAEAEDEHGLGILAITGGDVRALAMAGGAALVTGEALLLMRQALPEPQLAITAGTTSAGSAGQRAAEPGVDPSSSA